MSALAAANSVTDGGSQTRTGRQVPCSKISNHNYNARPMISNNIRTATASNNKNMRTRAATADQQLRQHQVAAATINNRSQRVDRSAEAPLNRQRPASSMASRSTSVLNSNMINISSATQQQHQQANGICGEQWSSPEILLSVSSKSFVCMSIVQLVSQLRLVSLLALNSIL